MARKPVPGADDGQWGNILNEFLDVSHVASGDLRDNIVNEAKLSAAVRTKLNNVGSGVADGSITTQKLADDAVTATKLANNAITSPAITDSAVSTAKISNLAVTDAKIASGISQAKISNLTNDLAAKANVSALAGKSDTTHTHALTDLSNVNTSGAVDGQALVFQGSQWAPATLTGEGGSGVTDHGALTGLSDDDHPQYLNSTRGDARYFTQAQVTSAINASASDKVDTSRQVVTSGSITGGGALTADRTLTLSGDSATPGNSKYYGTSAAGTKGFHDLPSGGGVSDHGALTGLGDDDHTQYHNDTRGDVRYYRKAEVDTAIGGRVATSVQVATTGSITGGGNLTANRTLTLSGDSATPGNNKYYGTNASGTKGYHDVPIASGAAAPLSATKHSRASNGATVIATAGQWLIVDAATGGVTVTLPAPANGIWVKVKKLDNSVNAVLVMPPSGQISAGSLTSNSISLNQWGMSYDFFGDGTEWHCA